MSDPIGTIRREDHKPGYEPGYSLWLHSQDRHTPCWRCIYSTNPANVGYPWETEWPDITGETQVIGVVPDTPAAEQSEARS